MQVQVRHSPSFAVARCMLAPGEPMNAESGAMVAMSYGVEVHSQTRGGIASAFKRSVLGGESFFVTQYTASPQAPGWVDVAQHLPGDIVSIDLDGTRGLVVTRGAWLANDARTTLNTQWGGSKMFFGGEGGFVAQASGTGPVVLGAYGALDVHDLPNGAGFTLDSGHLVAYEEGIQVNVRKMNTGIIQTLKSGEGLVMDFVGPGRVWTQSRNPGAFISWLSSVLPSRSS
jgi:uncharacterized protein (TIGR00266 family)